MSDSQAAFADLLATLGEVGDRYAGAEWGLTDPVDVAEGLRAVLHHLGTGIETQFEEDPAHPTFRAIVTPWRKSLGDNADARYHDAPVHPAGTYRVRGRTGGAVYVSFTVEAGAADGAFPSGTVGVLNDTGFDVAADGSFEITVGGPPRDRGWLPLAADASRLTVRHYWEDDRSPGAPPVADLGLTIDLLAGAVPTVPPAPSDASVAAAIRRMATYVRSRTLELARPGEGEPAGVRVPGAPRVPGPGHPRRSRAGRRRRRLQHGALPARARRGAGDPGDVACLPVRQRVAVDPPDADLRLPARPRQPQPGPGARRTRRGRDAGDRPP